MLTFPVCFLWIGLLLLAPFLLLAVAAAGPSFSQHAFHTQSFQTVALHLSCYVSALPFTPSLVLPLFARLDPPSPSKVNSRNHTDL